MELLGQRGDIAHRKIRGHAVGRCLNRTQKLGGVQCQHLVDDGHDQLALVRRAREVSVGIRAAAREHQRLVAVEVLLAFLDNDARPLGMSRGTVCVGIIDALGHFDVHAADCVDQFLQLAEVHFRVVRYLDAQQLIRFADGSGSAAVSVSGVELVRPVAVDIDLRIAGDGYHRGLVLCRIDAHHDVRVGTMHVLGAVLGLVGADEDHVEGLGEGHVLFGLERIVDGHDLFVRLVSLDQLLVDGVLPQGERRTAPHGHHENRDDHAEGYLLAAPGFLAGCRVAWIVARILTCRSLPGVRAVRAGT